MLSCCKVQLVQKIVQLPMSHRQLLTFLHHSMSQPCLQKLVPRCGSLSGTPTMALPKHLDLQAVPLIPPPLPRVLVVLVPSVLMAWERRLSQLTAIGRC